MPEELNFQTMPKWMPEALEIMALVSTWAHAYKVSDAAIIRQIPIAYSWCQSNKKKAPKKYPLRFLHTWMKNAKQWGNLVATPIDRTYKDKIVEQDMTVEELQEIRRRNFGEINHRRVLDAH